MLGLVIHKLADTSSALRYSPTTGQPEPRPLAGIRLEAAPDETGISTTKVDEGQKEGWISATGEQVVIRPSGPAHNKWLGDPHIFKHYDTITFHTVDGDITYRVTHQPDKYADDRVADERHMLNPEDDVLDDDEPVTDERYAAGETRVDWWYGLRKVS
jgi:hypothetical protein